MIGANRVRPYGIRWGCGIFLEMIPRSTAIHRGEYLIHRGEIWFIAVKFDSSRWIWKHRGGIWFTGFGAYSIRLYGVLGDLICPVFWFVTKYFNASRCVFVELVAPRFIAVYIWYIAVKFDSLCWISKIAMKFGSVKFDLSPCISIRWVQIKWCGANGICPYVVGHTFALFFNSSRILSMRRRDKSRRYDVVGQHRRFFQYVAIWKYFAVSIWKYFAAINRGATTSSYFIKNRCDTSTLPRYTATV